MGKKSKRKTQEVALGGRLQASLLSSLADATSATVVILDHYGLTLVASGQSRFSLPPAASWLDLVDLKDRPAAESIWLQAGLECRPTEGELTVQTADGPERVHCRIAPLKAEEGVLGWILMFSEMLGQGSAELRLLATKAEAQRNEAQSLLDRNEAELLETVARLSNLEGHLEENEAHLRNAEIHQRNMQSLLKERETQLSQSTFQVRELEDQLTNSNARTAEAEAHRHEVQSSLERSEAQVALLTSQLHALQSQMSDRDAHALDIHDQLGRACARVHELEGLLRESNARFIELEAQQSDLEARLQDSTIALKETEAALEASETQRGETVTRLQELEEQLRSSNQRAREAEVQGAEATARLEAGHTQRGEAQVLLQRSESQRIETEDRWRRSEALLAQAAARMLELQELLYRKEGERHEMDVRRSELEELLLGSQAQVAETEKQLVRAITHRQELQALLGTNESQRTPMAMHFDASDSGQVLARSQRQQAQPYLEVSDAQPAEFMPGPREPNMYPESSDASDAKSEVRQEKTADCIDADEQVTTVDALDAVEAVSPEGAVPQFGEPNPSADPRLMQSAASAPLRNEGEGAAPTADLQPDAPDSEDSATLMSDTRRDQSTNRMRSGVLREAFIRWRAAQGRAQVPRLENWHLAIPHISGYVVVALDEAGYPIQVLDARPLADTPLLRALTAPPSGEGQSWQRCATTGRPVYDYAHVEMGPHRSYRLERLLLPFSTVGARVDRLVMLMAKDDAEGALGQ